VEGEEWKEMRTAHVRDLMGKENITPISGAQSGEVSAVDTLTMFANPEIVAAAEGGLDGA
jgi:hypothetical protein